MKKPTNAGERGSIGRRSFIKTGAGAGAGAALTLLNGETVRAAGKEAEVQPWWNARPAKPGGKPQAIDLHAHWVPPALSKATAELGHPYPNSSPLEADIDARKEWMDGHGVLMTVLTLSGAMPWQQVSAEDGVRLAQIVNDAAVDAHMKYPDRYIAAIELPMRDPALALKELNRVAGKPGMRGVHLPDSIERRDYLFEPAFEPVLARCEELGYPILFHNLNGQANAFGAMAAGPGMDATFSHAVEAGLFITTGTLDKFPKLDIVLPHAGGAFPYIAGRMEHFMYHMGGAGVKLQHPFKDYLRRFHYDYLTYHPEGLRFLISLVGSDRIVVGTDSFNAKDIEYPGAVIEQFNFAAVDRDRMLKGNAMRLFKL